MSRDFLLKFNNKTDASNAENLLNSFYASTDNIKIFKVDNRGKGLFVELIYPNDIHENDSIYSNELNKKIEKFKSYVAFVAIKNET